MATRYGVLNYRGDLTGNPALAKDAILGQDEVGHPYEVLDADCRSCPDCDGEGRHELEDDEGRVYYADALCSPCGGTGLQTRVYLQHARPDNPNVKAALAQLQEFLRQFGGRR